MINITPFCSLESLCPYLGDRPSRTEYLYIKGCNKSLNSILVKRGYRRFGRYFQKPICANCNECISVRIDALKFKSSKSQRRVIRKNQHIRFAYHTPFADEERVELFKKYHKFKSLQREWKYYDINVYKYYDLYILGYLDFGKEISYYDENGKLICVDLVDVTDDGLSSVYCYYDPEYLNLSLGKFSLLNELEIVKKLNLRWIYLGYYVKNCQSLEYKKDFLPQEKLKEYVDFDKEPIWEEFKI